MNRISLLGLIAGALLTGCTVNKGLVVSSADRAPNDKVVGLVRGQSEKYYLFGGLFQQGDDSLSAAFEDAVAQSSVPAHGLIDVFAEKSCTYWLPPILWLCHTTVTGAVIQYGELGNYRVPIQKHADSDPPSNTSLCPSGQSYQNGACYTLIPGR